MTQKNPTRLMSMIGVAQNKIAVIRLSWYDVCMVDGDGPSGSPPEIREPGTRSSDQITGPPRFRQSLRILSVAGVRTGSRRA